jgi:hypothetical protein
MLSARKRNKKNKGDATKCLIFYILLALTPNISMKKILLSFAGIAVFSMTGMLFLNQGNLYSEATGAPSVNCATSGCHSDGGAAQSSADLFLMVKDTAGNIVTEYVSGQQYNVSFGKHNTNVKGGFALSPIGGTLAKNSGDSKVQKFSTYLTHTFAGTAIAGGEAEWSGVWTAPATGTAKLTLFFNEANNNGSNTGDKIYTQTLDLTRTATGLSSLNEDIRFKVYPNPAAEQLFIGFEVKYASPITITLTSIDGRQTSMLYDGMEAKGSVEKAFDISALAKGIYLLNIKTDNGIATQKLFVN